MSNFIFTIVFIFHAPNWSKVDMKIYEFNKTHNFNSESTYIY